MTTKELWAVYLYRLGNYIYIEAPRPLGGLLKLFWKPWNDWVSTLLDTHLMPTTRIGPGLYIGHTGGIWINPGAQLGANVNIGQGVVIGAAGGTRAPILGDRVWVGPHAVITGPVKVGDEAVVVGVPAKILSYSGSAKLIRMPKDH